MSGFIRRILWFPLVAILALPGVVFRAPGAAGRTPHWPSVAAIVFLLSMAALLVGTATEGREGRTGGPARRRMGLGVAAFFAMLMPLAWETQVAAVRAAGALATASLSAALICLSRGVSVLLAIPFAAVGCGLDATALVVPAAALGALPRVGRRGRRVHLLLAAGGLTGVMVAFLVGWPMVPVRSAHDAYAAHRDLVILLPVVTVALGGWLGGSANLEGPGRAGDNAFHRAWGTTSLVAGALVAAGLDASVPMACLGLWWHVPRGLGRLRCLAAATGVENASARRLAWLCGALLLFLLMPALRCWCDGVLMLMYVLAG